LPSGKGTLTFGRVTTEGFATTVARALHRNPADTTELREWAGRLHISVKTLQRDFLREYGTSYSRWRMSLRLRVSQSLLPSFSVAEVARRVGYRTPSAFCAAFAREFGYTPGRGRHRTA
jgi:AraC-like DNA-binding protein